MGIQGPEREGVNLEPLPPGVEEGPLLGSYRLEAAFPEQKLQGRGEGPTSYSLREQLCNHAWPSNHSWGEGSAPPTPVKAGHLLATCRHPGLTQPPPQPPEMRDRLLGLHPFASSGPRAPLAWRGLSPEASGVCPVLLLFQVVVFPAQISIPLPPGRKRPLPSEPRSPKIPTPK